MAERAESDKYLDAYRHLRRQLANPPEGWYTYGSHQDIPKGGGTVLDTWGEDVDGLPLWERVAYLY